VRSQARVIDPQAVLTTGMQTDSEERVEGDVANALVKLALERSPDPTQAYRRLVFAVGMLADECMHSGEVIDAAIALLTEWRDGPPEIQALFLAARSQLDKHLDALAAPAEDFDAGPTRDMSILTLMPEPPRKK
jgi:hypothetical protein